VLVVSLLQPASLPSDALERQVERQLGFLPSEGLEVVHAVDGTGQEVTKH
jgi:hypothetical protein